MTADDLCYLSAREALGLFEARALSPVELLKALIDHAEAVEPRINAFTETYFDEALDQARKAEARYMRGGARRRPLEGIPLAIKDYQRIAGKRTTSGSLVFKDNVPEESDIAVARLLKAGAICHARTTTPEFCIAGVTHSRLWGITRNPWNTAFDTGGSSGGSGAALAAGTTTLATGTDIGGSIRIPASSCGVFGFKPPYGRNPETPLFNLDFCSHNGALARSVGDLAAVQNVISGPHPRDIASLKPKLRIPDDPSSPGGAGGLRGLRIACSPSLGLYELRPAVAENFEAALEILRGLGAEPVPVEVPWTREHMAAFDDYMAHIFGTYVAEIAADHGELLTSYALEFAQAAEATSSRKLLNALRKAVEMYDWFGPLMDRFDLFCCPTLANPAAPAGSDPFHARIDWDGEERIMQQSEWEMTWPFNFLSRCPVMSVPTGFGAEGVPTGMQIVGRAYDDRRVFRAAAAYEAATGFYRSPAERPAVLS
jgi:amidase